MPTQETQTAPPAVILAPWRVATLANTEAMPLGDFLRLFKNENFSLEEFLVGCQRYPDFYRSVEPFLATLPLVSNPKEARNMLLEQVVNPLLDTEQTPDQIRRQAPDESVSLREVIQRSEDLKKVLDPDRENRLRALRETFASRLVDNFIAQSKLRVDASQRDGLIKAIDPALDATVAQLIEHPRLRPELALAIAGELIIEQPSLAPQKAAAAAMAHSLTLEVLTSRIDDPSQAALRTFFQANARGVQQLTAPVGDFLFRMLPKDWRTEIIEDQVAKSFGRVAKTVAKTIEATGRSISESPVFENYFRRAQHYQTDQQAGLSGVVKLRNAVSDVFTTVFGSPDPTTMAIYEAGRLGKGYVAEVKWQELWLGAHYASLSQKAPDLFGMTLSVAGNWGLSYAAKKGAAVAGEKLAGTALSRVLGGLFGAAGGPIGAIAGSVVLDKALGFVGGMFKGIFSFFSGEFLARLFAGTKTDWKTDLPLLLAIGSVGIIVLLFVFPWFLNPQFMYDLATKTPLAINSAGTATDTGAPGAGTCAVPAAGWCSVNHPISNLGRVFGPQAQNAAMVCNKESGYMAAGAARVVNDSCLAPELRQYVNPTRPATGDYSVGLFQINMLTQGELAFQNRPEGASLKEKLRRAGRAGKNCYDALSKTGLSCVVRDNVLLAACREWFQDPKNNIAYAVYLYNRRGWQPWTTARACGLVQ